MCYPELFEHRDNPRLYRLHRWHVCLRQRRRQHQPCRFPRARLPAGVKQVALKYDNQKQLPPSRGCFLVYKVAFCREIETFHQNKYYFLVIFDKENGCDSCKATILHSKSKKRLIFAKHGCNIKPQKGWKRYQPVNHTDPQRCNWFHLKRRTIP